MFSPVFSRGTTLRSMKLSGQPLYGWRFDSPLPIIECLSPEPLSTSYTSFDSSQFPSLGTQCLSQALSLGPRSLVEGRTNGAEFGNLGVRGKHARDQEQVLRARNKANLLRTQFIDIVCLA